MSRPLRAVLALLVLAPLLGPAPAAAAPAPDAPSAAQIRSKLAEALRGTGGPGADQFIVIGDDVGRSITAGAAHTCTTTVTGSAWCWGAGGGRLGTGGPAGSALPVPVDVTAEVSYAVDAGRAHTCGLGSTEDMSCWGANGSGQLGTGSTVDSAAPVPVLTRVTRIAAGGDHTCAARVNGTVWCWGDNTWGQAGTGVTGGVQTTPRRVPGLTGITDVAAGDRSTCAVAEAARAVWCWGSDADGQLGDGGGTPAAVPTPVPVTIPAGQGVLQGVTIGRAHACAHTDTGVVWCWGADGSGQLGNGAAGPATTPQRIGELGIGISAGGDSTCAASAPAACWGDNSSGQLGTGDRTDRDVPTVGALGELRGSPFVEAVYGYAGPLLFGVAVGGDHACAVDATSGVYCWGSGADGRLGTAATADSDVPALTRLLPGQATGVVARPAAGALDVGWDRPAQAGAAPIDTQVAVAIARDGLTESCDPFASAAPTAANDCTVRDLAGGRRYAVTVGVGNAAGVTFSELAYGTPRPGGGGGSLPITGAGLSAYLLLAVVLVAAGTVAIVLVSRSGPRRRRA